MGALPLFGHTDSHIEQLFYTLNTRSAKTRKDGILSNLHPLLFLSILFPLFSLGWHRCCFAQLRASALFVRFATAGPRPKF